MCIMDLDELHLIWWIDFKLDEHFRTELAAPTAKNITHFEGVKSEPKLIIPLFSLVYPASIQNPLWVKNKFSLKRDFIRTKFIDGA